MEHITDRVEILRSLILSSSSAEMDQIIDAVMLRMEQLYPDDEINFLSLPCNDTAEREQIITNAADMIRNHRRPYHYKPSSRG